ncbi:MAG TPA: hypothetical protein ENN69_01220 [Spirochaetia bacterium]|nr:hypothetical protein [Spirochaetia bacterium]
MKKPVLIGFLIVTALLFMSGCGEEESPVLSPSQKPPLLDGAVTPEEYSLSYDFDTLKLFLSRSGDVIFLGLVSTLPGWAAVGVGSDKMNGAVMIIGYVRDGEAVVTEQLGTGHRHSPSEPGDGILRASAITERNGLVSLEVELPVSAVIPDGAAAFPVLIAASDTDSFSEYHSIRREVTVRIE